MTYFKKFYITIFSFGLIIYSILIRFWQLGKDELLGDELNALKFLPHITANIPTVSEFINTTLTNDRGPGQYIINYLNIIIFGFRNEWYIRMPFFVISIIAYYALYLLAKKVFNNSQIALLSVLLMAFNGLYIAFARSSQYQSLLYLLIPLSVYLFIHGLKNVKYLYIALSGIILAIAFLCHYDALVAGFFFAPFLVSMLLHNIKKFRYYVFSGLTFLVFFILPVLPFYSSYFFSDRYSSKTSDYLEERIFGGGFMPRTPYSQLGELLTVYMPAPIWLLSFIFIVLGLIFLVNKVDYLQFFRHKINVRNLYIFATLLYSFAFFFSLFPYKPRTATLLTYLSVGVLVLILMLSKKIKPYVSAIFVWWLISYSIYFFFIRDPRTHVYITFIPGFLVSAYGIYSFSLFVKSKFTLLSFITKLFFVFITIYMCLFYYLVYLQTDPQYPWSKKYLFGRELRYITRSGGTHVRGLFGFSSYNHWDTIRKYYDKGCLKGSYSSNEKNTVTYFYLSRPQVNTKKPELYHLSDTSIYVVNTTVWYHVPRKKVEQDKNIIHLKTLYNGTIPVVYLYGSVLAYPNGFECL